MAKSFIMFSALLAMIFNCNVSMSLHTISPRFVPCSPPTTDGIPCIIVEDFVPYDPMFLISRGLTPSVPPEPQSPTPTPSVPSPEHQSPAPTPSVPSPEHQSPTPTPLVPSPEPQSPTPTPAIVPSPEHQSPTPTPTVPGPEPQSPTSSPSVPIPKSPPVISPKPKHSSASIASQSHYLSVIVLLITILFV